MMMLPGITDSDSTASNLSDTYSSMSTIPSYDRLQQVRQVTSLDRGFVNLSADERDGNEASDSSKAQRINILSGNLPDIRIIASQPIFLPNQEYGWGDLPQSSPYFSASLPSSYKLPNTLKL